MIDVKPSYDVLLNPDLFSPDKIGRVTYYYDEASGELRRRAEFPGAGVDETVLLKGVLQPPTLTTPLFTGIPLAASPEGVHIEFTIKFLWDRRQFSYAAEALKRSFAPGS